MEKLRIYRFQKNRFYGGVATAFCGECNINCIYCYSQNHRNTGKYLEAEEIGEKIVKLIDKHDLKYARISGGDPLSKYTELEKVLNYVLSRRDVKMIVETNGIEIGRNPEIAKSLSQFDEDNLIVRVSVKHFDPEKFHYLTGAPEDWCVLTFDGLKVLRDNQVPHIISWMEEWFNDGEWAAWFEFLEGKGYCKPAEDYPSFDEWFEDQLLIDPESFRRYASVPVSKKEILNKLREIDIEHGIE